MNKRSREENSEETPDEEVQQVEDEDESDFPGLVRTQALISERRKKQQLGDKYESLEREIENAEIIDTAPEESEGPFEPFSLIKDSEDGKFDEDGNFVWAEKKNITEKQDAWINQIHPEENFSSEKEKAEAIKRAQMYDEVFGRKQFEESVNEEEERLREMNEGVEELISYLGDNETPADALRRLKPKKGKFGGVSKNPAIRKTKGGALSKKSQEEKEFGTRDSNCARQARQEQVPTRNVEMKESEDPEANRQFERITEICDMLLTNGIMVYAERRNSIANLKIGISDLRKEKMWEFRWKNDPETIHGKYPSIQLCAWKQQGFFDQENKAEFRQVSTVRENEWVSFGDLNWDEIVEDSKRSQEVEENSSDEDQELDDETTEDLLNEKVLERIFNN